MYGVVYRITNKLDGMSYVGQTTRSVEGRFKEHSRYKKSHIGNAIRKYGAENFTIEILDVCETPEQLNERERFRIAELDCQHPNGYNYTDGGERDFRILPETCAKMSASKTGEKHHQYGKPLTKEWKEKLAASQPRRRAVVCVELNIIYPSLSEAARCYNVTPTNILTACKRTHTTIKGFHWRYLNESTDVDKNPVIDKRKRPIICIETNEKFESTAEAARHYKTTAENIQRACKNYAKTAVKLHWCYLEDFATRNVVTESIPGKPTKPRAVLCIETGKRFESISAAGRFYKIRSANICRACKNPQSKAANLHWRYADAPQA